MGNRGAVMYLVIEADMKKKATLTTLTQEPLIVEQWLREHGEV